MAMLATVGCRGHRRSPTRGQQATGVPTLRYPISVASTASADDWPRVADASREQDALERLPAAGIPLPVSAGQSGRSSTSGQPRRGCRPFAIASRCRHGAAGVAQAEPRSWVYVPGNRERGLRRAARPFVQQRQVRGNKIPIRTSVAEQEYLARSVELQSEMARVEIAVRLAFFRTLVARRRVELTRDLVNLAQQTSAAMGRLVDAEEMTKTAEIQAQLAVSNLRTQLITAEQQYSAGRRSLARLLNIPDVELPELTCGGFDELPDYQWPQLEEWATDSLKTQRQQYLVDKAARQLTLERARQIVDFDYQAWVYYDDLTSDVAAGLQVSRPLLWHDWNQGNIQRASAELRAANNDVGSIVQKTLVGLARAYRDYEAQRGIARLIAAQQLPKSREGLELTQLALREGEIGYLEALVSQQTYADANEQYFVALDAAWQAAAQLELQFVD